MAPALESAGGGENGKLLQVLCALRPCGEKSGSLSFCVSLKQVWGWGWGGQVLSELQVVTGRMSLRPVITQS